MFLKKSNEKLLEVAMKIIEKYPKKSLIPSKWLLQSDVENVEFHLNVLIQHNPNSVYGLAATGVQAFNIRDFATAKDLLEQANKLQTKGKLCLETLAHAYLEVGAYALAEDTFRILLDKSDRIDIGLCKSIVFQGDKSKMTEAIQLCKPLIPKVAGNEQIEMLSFLARALIFNDQLNAAEQTILKIKSLEGEDNLQSTILLALKSRITRSVDEILPILKSKSYNNCLYYLELGQINYILECYEDALVAFLKATKLEPYNAACFFWLAKIYEINNDETRMRKCLEKSLSLNIQNKAGVIMLSKIYRKNHEFDVNKMLLENLVNICSKNEKGWAWRQLGLNYLTASNYNDAINAFRFTLRYDASDVASWEGLADSYLARGSYSSAMKVYQKAIELNSGNLYAQLQVAKIHLVG